MQPEREPGVRACTEVPPRRLDAEGSTLDEDIGRGGDPRGVGEHLGDRPVDVGIGIPLLGWNGVRAQPGRHATRRRDRVELRELRIAIEAVAALPLERRRPVPEHRVPVPDDDLAQGSSPCRAGRPRRREDAAAGRQELLVGRADGAESELLDAVARERRMRVAVDEAGNRRQARAVELLDVGAVHGREVAHRTHCSDRAVRVDEHVATLDDLDLAERRAPQRTFLSTMGDDLREVADQQPGHSIDGRSSAVLRARSIASG